MEFKLILLVQLLRAIAFQRQELAEPYLYLLDIETYDEA